jgi:hypothetical protein
MCLYRAELSDVSAADDGLVAEPSAAVRHRPDLVERLDAKGAPQPVSSLQVGHRHVKFPDRPWYRQKREPSLADRLTTLRRLSWEEHFRGLLPKTRLVKTSLAQITEFLALAG